METLDLGANSPKEIAKMVNEMDEKYGPISHLYAISGISNHIKDSSPWNMASFPYLLYSQLVVDEWLCRKSLRR